MICLKCGKDNNYYHIYCYECGNKLQTGENLEDLPQSEVSDTPTPVIFNNESDNVGLFSINRLLKVVTFAVIIVIGTFGLALIGFNFLKNRSGENLANASAPAISSSELLAGTPPNTSPPALTPAPTSTPLPIKLELVQPSSGHDSTEANQYVISFTTNGSKIYLNDEQQDINLVSNGNISLNLNLSQFGENSFKIKAIDQYNQEKEFTVIINKLYPLVPLVLADNQVLSTNKSGIVVSGTTLAGAQIVLKSNLTYKEPIKVDSKGEFSIELSLPVIPGQYVVDITATAKDHRDATMSFDIEKLIDEKAYKKAAVACKYDTLLNNPAEYIGKVVVLSGTVDTLDANDTKKFMFRMNKKSSQMVYIEYRGNTSMAKGVVRKLYGEYVDTVNGLPHLLIRMAYRIATTSEEPWEPAT